MSKTQSSTWRIWLIPLSVLLGLSLTLFVLTCLADSASMGDPWQLFRLVIHPNPAAAANTLGNAGEIVAAVLAIAITVVAIIVELASNRYTHRVTELFIAEPTNFFVMSLFVVTAVEALWVTMIIDQNNMNAATMPYISIGVTMALLTACLLILLPYFNFVFAYLNPVQIVDRISTHTLEVIAAKSSKSSIDDRKREASRGVEQLADVAVNAMEHRDKGVSMASVNALKQLAIDYQGVRAGLSPAWFRVEGEIAANPDFVSMDAEVLGEVADRRIWFEMKVLRQYQMVYAEAVNHMRDIAYVIAINTRLLAEEAARQNQIELLHLCMKFFNTYLRAAINAKDVRTAYNVFNQYRLLAQSLLGFKNGTYSVEIARYFKYYGLISFSASLPFILETVAYDLCTLNETALDQGSPVVDDLLRLFLRVDKESEGEVQEASLRGVRKAQVKLATYYLLKGEVARARQVFDDMAGEDVTRMASIRDELFGVQSSEYWEITDRGANFDFLPKERKVKLEEFFSWFAGLPTARSGFVSQLPAAPGGGAAELELQDE
ncbi:MAG TPA: DUF2254 family protein [Polyangiales bacterium]